MPSLRRLECGVPIYDSGQRRQNQSPAFARTSLDAFDSTSARSSLRETPISESPISSASFSGVTLIRTASRVRDLRDLVPAFKLSSWLDMVAFVYSAELPSRECRLLAIMLQLKIEGLTSTLKMRPTTQMEPRKTSGRQGADLARLKSL